MTGVTRVNEGVRVFDDRPCYLCGRPGRAAWSHLRDRLYSAPGEWRMMECRRCDLFWLDPGPTEAGPVAASSAY